MKGHISKAEYAETLRAHQQCVDAMRSEQRDGAAASVDTTIDIFTVE